MTSFLGELYTALKGTLSNATALTSLLTHGATSGSNYIYALQAPDSATAPYVVYSMQSSLTEVPQQIHNTVVSIRAYSPNLSTAANIQGAIENTIDGKNLTMTTYTNFYVAKDQDIGFCENLPNGTKMYMMGGLFRFRSDK